MTIKRVSAIINYANSASLKEKQRTGDMDCITTIFYGCNGKAAIHHLAGEVVNTDRDKYVLRIIEELGSEIAKVEINSPFAGVTIDNSQIVLCMQFEECAVKSMDRAFEYIHA